MIPQKPPTVMSYKLHLCWVRGTPCQDHPKVEVTALEPRASARQRFLIHGQPFTNTGDPPGQWRMSRETLPLSQVSSHQWPTHILPPLLMPHTHVRTHSNTCTHRHTHMLILAHSHTCSYSHTRTHFSHGHTLSCMHTHVHTYSHAHTHKHSPYMGVFIFLHQATESLYPHLTILTDTLVQRWESLCNMYPFGQGKLLSKENSM